MTSDSSIRNDADGFSTHPGFSTHHDSHDIVLPPSLLSKLFSVTDANISPSAKNTRSGAIHIPDAVEEGWAAVQSKRDLF
jgi:hypothetical protein